MASVHKRTDRDGYRVRWREGSRMRSRSFDKARDAKAFAATVEADQARGTYVDPDAGKVTLQAFASHWLAAQTFDASTLEAVETRLRVHILPQLGHLELRQIKPSTVQAWLRGRQEDLAPRTVRVVLANLSSILGAALDDDLIRKNPARSGSVKAPAIPDRQLVPWTSQQVAGVLAALPHRWRGVGALAAGCGLRQGEAFGVHVDDLDFLGRRVLVRHQIKYVDKRPAIAAPKRNKTREVPLPDAVAFVLSETLRQWPARGDGLVFVTRENNPVDRNYFNRTVWRPALAGGGLEPGRGNGMHALRHYFASTLLEAGVNPRAVADYLGHADPGFTLRVYGHLMPTSEDRVRQTMDAALGAEAGRDVPRMFPGQGA